MKMATDHEVRLITDSCTGTDNDDGDDDDDDDDDDDNNNNTTIS